MSEVCFHKKSLELAETLLAQTPLCAPSHIWRLRSELVEKMRRLVSEAQERETRLNPAGGTVLTARSRGQAGSSPDGEGVDGQRPVSDGGR